ncbi:MAG TPA: GNAT family N-acetyltransferase [Clostridiales bacterium]|nr:GNAT family N-acetyltransferase [Clostridiales bacterium]HOL79255.1 GNAT family N-acetyltransferase [Clostridiales bacterium]HPP68591.1 GNAT family N-acetyltransferase [Clostridiales bacterium]
MLKLLNDDTYFQARRQLENNQFGAVIGSLYKAYGNSCDYCVCLCQKSDDGRITALISVFMGSMTLYCETDADFEELRLYIKSASPFEILSDLKTIEMSGLKIQSTGSIMELDTNAELSLSSSKAGECKAAIVPADYRELSGLYDIIFESQAKSPEHFRIWYAHASHMIRHGFIRAAAVKNKDGTPVACAFTQCENSVLSVITSVAVKEKHRRQGLGSFAVGFLANKLRKEGKKVYLFSKDENTDKFYLNNGFFVCGNWAKAVIQ